MGQVADRLAAMTITVSSPDGGVEARIRHRDPRSVTFAPGRYQQYEYDELERQLAALARRCFVGYQRGVSTIMAATSVDVVLEPERARNPAQAAYLREVAKLRVYGPRRDRALVFGVEGTAHWRCRLAPGVLDRLSQVEFEAACLTAGREFLRFFEFEKLVLRNKHLGARRLNLTGRRRWWD